MIKTLVANSGLHMASDNIYYRLKAGKNGLLGITEDTTANTLTLHFREKDNSQDGAETVVLKCESGKTAEAAEDVISLMNGIAKNAQIEKVVNLFDKVEGVKGVNFTFAYEAEVANEDLEIDPDAEALADETVTIGFQSLDADSGPYRCVAFIKNTDSTGEDDVIINGKELKANVTADTNGKFELSIPGIYDASGTDTAIPETASDIVNTAEVTLTNDKSNHSVSVSAVIEITHAT